MAIKIRSTNIQPGALDSDVLIEGIGVSGRVSVLDSVDDLPIGLIPNGTMALAKGSTNELFIHNSSKGWFQLLKLNESPTPITGLNASYEIPNNNDSALTLTLNSTDPEGIPLIWNYQTTGDASVARISNKKNVFTVRKSPRGGISSFTTTFSASDGVNVVTASSQFTLAPEIEYLIVGGGGGGGTGGAGGGGGAGGLLTGTAKLAIGSYTVTVGTGGASGQNGEDSTFNNKVAVGGGRGGNMVWNSVESGQPGGSGGGGASGYNTGSRGGGAGVSGQGNNGGTAVQFSSSSYTSAGGGGAGGAGVNSTTTKAGNGGAGYQWLDGNFYAGGGGGGIIDESSGDQPGIGGSSVGGNGAWNKAPGGAIGGTNGAANTGSGGGGGGGAGADGVVIIRYPTGAFGLVPVTGGTITQSGGYTYHKFTSRASFKIGPALPTLEYLVVAGGGGGGNGHSNGAGGGGGGGMVRAGGITISETPYSAEVVVGAGGAGGASAVAKNDGGDGENSSFGNIVSLGGGGGGGRGGQGAPNGAVGLAQDGINAAPTGGLGIDGAGAGGGGGAGGPGGAGGGRDTFGGASGFGRSSDITGTFVTYSTGGRGGVDTGPTAGANGAANTGNGGGGGSAPGFQQAAGGNGGSGVVIIRYATGAFGDDSVGGGTITTGSGFTYHTFTSDGTFTIG